jgi:hypothetical protein
MDHNFDRAFTWQRPGETAEHRRDATTQTLPPRPSYRIVMGLTNTPSGWGVIGTAGTVILRPQLFVSLEASIRECTVNSSLLECPVSGIHSVSEFRRCPQHRLHPCPKLWVVQPVLIRRADRASANIEGHLTSKSESRVSREFVAFSMSSPGRQIRFCGEASPWEKSSP